MLNRIIGFFKNRHKEPVEEFAPEDFLEKTGRFILTNVPADKERQAKIVPIYVAPSGTELINPYSDVWETIKEGSTYSSNGRTFERL